MLPAAAGALFEALLLIGPRCDIHATHGIRRVITLNNEFSNSCDAFDSVVFDDDGEARSRMPDPRERIV
jgi:hypothetical protein